MIMGWTWDISLHARPSLAALAADTGSGGCEQGVSYRFAGLAGILIITLGFWAVAELGSAVVHGAPFSRRRSRQPTGPRTANTVHQYQVTRVDVGHQAHLRTVRSHLRSAGAGAGFCALMLLLPATAIFIFFILSGSILLVLIGMRDLGAGGYWQTHGGRQRQNRNSVGSGPPLFTDSNQRNLPFILGLLWPGLSLIGFGFLCSWIAGGTVVCDEAGKARLTLVRFALGAGFMAAGLFLIWAARRAATRRSADLLAADQRAPVLYLRSFSDDAVRIRTDRWARRTMFDRLSGPVRERFEQIVAWHLWSYGPVIAIRRPRGSRQPVGAAREELDNDEWMRQIDEWLVSARLVSITLGRTAGLQWEINRIRDLGLREKLLILFPPVGGPELDSRWREFLRSWEPGAATAPLLTGSGHVLAATLTGPDGATLITSHRRDEASYRLAIMAAAQRLRIAPLGWNLARRHRTAAGRALPTPLAHPGVQGKLYYLAQPDEVIGPFGLIQLRRMAADRQITAATLLTTEGQPWTPIAQIPGIYSSRSRRTALALAFFGGILGLDRFYLGKVGTGLAKLLTIGGMGLWWLTDLIGLGTHLTTDIDGRPLRE
jgi:hypothetical protein